MKYKFRDLTIVNQNTLSSKDLLEREKNFDVFKQLIDECKAGGVIALHGTWGTGKTTFVRMLIEKLPKRDYDCVYYNAWQYDHSNDPLLPLIAEFKGKFSDVSHDKLEKFTWALAKVSLEALPTLSSAIVSMFSGGGLFANASNEVAKKVTDMINRKFENYKNYKNCIRGFQEAVQECIFQDRQLVFFIDELDRCTPSFAVRTLELIKHLFIIPNVVFVLSIDKIQLAHSICGYYGSETFDAVDYLRRFIDIEYNLPSGNLGNLLERYFDEFDFKTLCEKKSTTYSSSDLYHFVILICIVRKLSIRQIEKWLIALGHALETTKNLKIDTPTIAMLTYLRTFDYGFYIQYFNWEISDQTIIDYFQDNFHSQFFDIGNETGRIIAHDVVAQIIWLRYGDETLRGFTENVLEDKKFKLHLKEINKKHLLISLTAYTDLRTMSPINLLFDAIEMK